MEKFDNTKDCLEYLKNHAKEGETVMLDERATATHPRRVHKFMRSSHNKGEKK